MDLEKVMCTLDATIHLPDHREVTCWIRKMQKTHKPFSLAIDGTYRDHTCKTYRIFWAHTTISHTKEGKITYITVRGMNRDNAGSATYSGITIRDTPPEAMLDYILANDHFWGPVDPTTLLAVMRTREESKGVADYGSKEVRKYLVDLSRYFISTGLLLDDGHQWHRANEAITTDDIQEGKMRVLPPGGKFGRGDLSPTENYISDLIRLALQVYVWTEKSEKILRNGMLHSRWLETIPVEGRDEILRNLTKQVLIDARAAYLSI